VRFHAQVQTAIQPPELTAQARWRRPKRSLAKHVRRDAMAFESAVRYDAIDCVAQERLRVTSGR
jgi:hypothetical protein